MSSKTTTSTPTVESRESGNWKAGALAGVAGGVVFGVLLTMMMTPVIEMAIPAMYGLEGILAGWVIHVFHGAVIGVVFAGLAGALGYGDNLARSVGLGVVYGVVVWVLLAAIAMPIWLSAVGFPNAPPLPNFDPQSLVGHVVYGIVVGAVYPYFTDL